MMSYTKNMKLIEEGVEKLEENQMTNAAENVEFNEKEWREGWQAAIEQVMKVIRKNAEDTDSVDHRKALAYIIRVLWGMSEEWDDAMANQFPTVTDHFYPVMRRKEEEPLQKKSQFWLAGVSDVEKQEEPCA